MQWGRLTGVNGGDVAVTFPIPFPSVAASLTLGELTGPQANPIATSTLTTTGFVGNTVSAGQVYTYIALGF